MFQLCYAVFSWTRFNHKRWEGVRNYIDYLRFSPNPFICWNREYDNRVQIPCQLKLSDENLKWNMYKLISASYGKVWTRRLYENRIYSAVKNLKSPISLDLNLLEIEINIKKNWRIFIKQLKGKLSKLFFRSYN